MGIFSNKISRELLKPGDHIYSWRYAYIYAHHGIYAGEGKIIHFTRGSSGKIIHFNGGSSGETPPPVTVATTAAACPSCEHQKHRSGVVSTCLECFLKGGEPYRFEYGVGPAMLVAKARGGTCCLAESDPAEDVLRRAVHLLRGGGFGLYDLFSNNCEDFAVYCKTGLLLVGPTAVGSGQVATYLLAASSAAVSSPLQLLAAGLAAACFVTVFCIGRVVTDVGVRCNVAKVPAEMLLPDHSKSSSS